MDNGLTQVLNGGKKEDEHIDTLSINTNQKRIDTSTQDDCDGIGSVMQMQ